MERAEAISLLRLHLLSFGKEREKKFMTGDKKEVDVTPFLSVKKKLTSFPGERLRAMASLGIPNLLGFLSIISYRYRVSPKKVPLSHRKVPSSL